MSRGDGLLHLGTGKGYGHRVTVWITGPEGRRVTMPGGSAGDQSVKRRVVKRDTHGGAAERRPWEKARPRSGEREPAMPIEERRAVTCGGYTSAGRASERPGETADAASRTRSGNGRIGSSGEGERERRWRVSAEPRCASLGTAKKGGRSLTEERRTGLTRKREAPAHAAMQYTGIPSWRALSTRFPVIPDPGNAMTPLGSRFSSSSFLRKGAALPCAFQSGRHTT